MKKLSTALAAALLATACSAGPAPLPGADKPVTVRGPVVEAASYKLQAALPTSPRVPYELKRVDHIEVWLDNTDDADPAALAGTLNYIGSADDDHTFDDIVLANLKAYAHYKVQLKAWQKDPAFDNQLVQVDLNDAGQSETTFDTLHPTVAGAANEDVHVAGGFKLALKDQAFNATAQGGGLAASTTDGVLLDPTNAPVIGTIPPISNFVAQVVEDDSTPTLLVDTDLVIHREGGATYTQHTSNPCGGGWACGTPGDPAYNPESASFLLNESAPASSIVKFRVTINDGPQTKLGWIYLKYDFDAAEWKFQKHVKDPTGWTGWKFQESPAN